MTPTQIHKEAIAKCEEMRPSLQEISDSIPSDPHHACYLQGVRDIMADLIAYHQDRLKELEGNNDV